VEQVNMPVIGLLLYLHLMVGASSFEQALGWFFKLRNVFMCQFIYSRSFF
jgi:hypothetical protein